MDSALRWCLILILGFGIPARAGDKREKEEEKAAMAQIREELGVNQFTAPSIQIIFEELAALKSIPFDKVWQDLPDSTPSNRSQLALTAGETIANGFLAVAAQKQSRIEPVGRYLLKLAKGLGVADHVTKHSRAILEHAAQQKWDSVKTELVRSQADVEAGMMALKDEEIAHLVSLGGWLRGLEIVATTVAEDYSPESARRLIQPELFDYFLNRLKTLNPDLKQTPLFQQIETNLKSVYQMTQKTGDTPITLDEVKNIRRLTHETNKAITTPQE